MHKIFQGAAWILVIALPCFFSLPGMGNIDPDIVDSIFGSSMDSARYGSIAEDWEEIPITLLPEDTDCKPIQSPRKEPNFMQIHEELKPIVVIKENGNRKCDYYKETQGFECVPYYQCGDDGTIITDGYGLIDIRFGGSESSPEFALLDSTDLMCPGSLDVCCKDPDFVNTTPAPIISSTTQSYGGGDTDTDSEESKESKEDHEEIPSEVDDKSNEGGYGGEDDDGKDGDGKTGDDNAVCVGDCGLPLKYEPRCGRRNLYGLGVRVQNYKDGESQFGEWPHICAVLNVQTTDSGYGASEEVKLFTGGASLIAPGAVLTAAHKVLDFVDTPGQLLVRCGEWDTQTSSEPLKHQDRKVKKVVIHPDFNKRNMGNTAAILILESDFVLGEHIDTICLPETDEVFDEVSDCFVKGWGKDKWEDGEYQVVLKKVSVPMVARKECEKAMKGSRLGRRFRLDPSFVCAGGEVGQDACKGDGGGPLVCPMKSDPDRYVQVGIVAWGIGCGTELPGVYTSVSHIGCWIDYTLKCENIQGYEHRYGSECNAWLQSKSGNRPSAKYPCTMFWESKLDKQVEDPGYAAPSSSLPQKIQVEEKSVGGY